MVNTAFQPSLPVAGVQAMWVWVKKKKNMPEGPRDRPWDIFQPSHYRTTQSM